MLVSFNELETCSSNLPKYTQSSLIERTGHVVRERATRGVRSLFSFTLQYRLFISVVVLLKMPKPTLPVKVLP